MYSRALSQARRRILNTSSNQHLGIRNVLKTFPEYARVRKVGGSFQHTGIVVAQFLTTRGEKRIVLEFDAPVDGMLHIYRPDQVELIEND